MKFSVATFLVLLPLVSQATAASVPRFVARSSSNNNVNRKSSNNAGSSSAGAAATTAAASSSAAVSATATASAAVSSSTAAAASANSTDPQTSLTLDPAVIASGFDNNGQDVPTAGQVASLTSTNNFINFCLTVPDLPLTNGQQITTGSCNPAPMGTIPSVDNMPSAKFTFPQNGGTIQAEQSFNISMAINNLATGNFVNANENYFAAPQQLDSTGTIIGHSHVVVEQLSAIDQTTPTNPLNFAFFKGLNDAAVDGVLTATVTSGLPAGAYRLCSINTCANHQPALVAIAQHGSLDDCIYFSATASGVADTTTAATVATAATSSAAAVAATPTSAAEAAATTSAATSTSTSKSSNKNTSKARRFLRRL
ncbi:hypothetical protein H0H92_007421 [Tricholoma furcatifolium]|nr:hypothetical protein H0H92_007421 [Tricholoma furcatifolium]